MIVVLLIGIFALSASGAVSVHDREDAEALFEDTLETVSAPTEPAEPRDTRESEPDHFGDVDEGDIDPAVVERLVEQRANQVRETHGESPLASHDGIATVAREHSLDMAEHEFVGHAGSDGSSPQDRVDRAGISCYVGENAAMTWFERPVAVNGERVTYHTAEELAEGLVDQWMDSPGHRENLLESRYEIHGVGIVITDDGAVFATHKMCL